MIHKWKYILTNWINCYFNKNKNHCITFETILNIISHLRENLNLDESKSSILEAHTVEEFIAEKYPNFSFPNGSFDINNEEDIYIIASLLLFFVCINSKDVNIKNAMCSKLSDQDQETILKFSKSLMQCSLISYGEVQAAITESCGQDVAGVESESVRVAETPPALRSLHSEVRRLQAALDAERFDRNYLQEELSRTSLRIQKLLKDTEHYKLEIVNLKAKISLSGQDETQPNNDGVAVRSTMLARQLQETEERLVCTQGQLDDVLCERDMYKSKLEELKHERDKLLLASTEEASRANRLSDELESERREVVSLRELVTELRQHNQNNHVFDSSLLECDDPDASASVLQHNLSVCSEACANVIEVQLGEERAKIVVLQQQIQTLQDQINELNNKVENDRQSYEAIISQKENDIFSLKHRINEEIEENQNLRAQFNNEVTRLNNTVNELEQKCKEQYNHLHLVIEDKIHEIKTLQEEKMSLLQSLSDEITKLEKINEDHKSEISAERNSRARIKEDYENRLMDMKNKVLNRNNELVEFQNSMVQQSEMIEQLHLDLKTEKRLKDELTNKYQDDILRLNNNITVIENNLRRKTEEAKSLEKKLDLNIVLIEEMNKEIESLRSATKNLKENCSNLEETKASLLIEINNRDSRLEELQRSMSNVTNSFLEEKSQLQHSLEDKEETIKKLKVKLLKEFELKHELMEKHKKVLDENNLIQEKNVSLKQNLQRLDEEIQEKTHTVCVIDMNLKEEKKVNDELKIECNNLNSKIKIMSTEITDRENEIKSVNEKLQQISHVLEEKNKVIEMQESKLHSEITEKSSILDTVNSLNAVNSELKDTIDKKFKEFAQLQIEFKQISEANISLQHKVQEESKRIIEMEKKYNVDRNNLTTKIKTLENTIKNNESKIESISTEKNDLEKIIHNNIENIAMLEKEKETTVHKLNLEMSLKHKLQNEYENKCCMLKNVIKDCTLKSKENLELEKTIQILNNEKCDEIKFIEEQLTQEKLDKQNIITEKNLLQKEVCMLKQVEQELNEEIEKKNKTIDNINLYLKEKDRSNDALQIECKDLKSKLTRLSQEVIDKDKTIKLIEEKLDSESKSLTEVLQEKNKVIDMQESKMNLEIVEKKSLCNENSQLHIDLKQISENNTLLQHRLQEETTKYLQLEKTYNLETIKLENIIKEKDFKIETLSTEADNLRKTICNNVDNIASLQNEKQAITKKLYEEVANKDKLQKEFENKCTMSQTLIEECASKSRVIGVMKTEIQELNNIIKEKCEEIEKSQNKVIEEQNILSNEKIIILQENNALNQELLNLNKEIEEKDRIINNINLHLKEEKLDNENLRRECSDLNSKINRMSQEMTNRENNIKLIQAECENESKSLAEVLQEKNKIIDEQNSKLIVEIAEKQDLAHTVRHLTNEKHNLEETINAKIREIAEIQLEFRHISESNIILQQRLQEENTKYIEFQKKYEMDVTKLQTNLNELEIGIKDKQFKIESLTTEIDNIQKVNQSSIENIAVLEKEKAVADYKFNEEKILRDKLQTECDSKTKEVMALKNKTQMLNKTIEEKCNEIKNIQDNLTKEMKEDQKLFYNENNLLKQQLLNLNKEINEKNKTIVALNLQLQEEKLISEQFGIKCKELNSQLDVMSLEITKKNNEIKLIEEKLNNESKLNADILQEKNQIINTIERKLNSEMDEKNSLLSTVMSLNGDKLTLRENLNDKCKEITQIHTSLQNKLQDEITKYIELNNKYELETNKLHAIINTEQCTIKELSSEIDNLQQKFIEENTKFVELEKTYEIEVNKLLANLNEKETTIKENENNIKTLSLERDKLQQKLQDDNSSSVEVEKQHETEINKLFVKLTESQDIIKENELKIAALSLERDSLQAKLEDQSTKFEGLEKKLESLLSSLNENENRIKEYEVKIESLSTERDNLQRTIISNVENITSLEKDKNILNSKLSEEKILKDTLQIEFENKCTMLTNVSDELDAKSKEVKALETMRQSLNEIIEQKNAEIKKMEEKLLQLENELKNVISDKTSEIKELQEKIDYLQSRNEEWSQEVEKEKAKYNELKDCLNLELAQEKSSNQILNEDIKTLKDEHFNFKQTVLEEKMDLEENLKKKDHITLELMQEKDAVITALSKDLFTEKALKEEYQKHLDTKTVENNDLLQKIDNLKCEMEVIEILKMENEDLVKAVGQKSTFALPNQETTSQKSGHEKEHRDIQVDSTTSDLTHSSMESIKTISDLEKIIHNKNRTITTLQTDITYMKSLMADSENKLLDVRKELELSEENCQQLSNQLKKIVHQKNDEIAELKKQINKMTVNENRASQIIKVSAKYQAIIFKRIAEIKSNTVLKELTNFGNTNGDNELRRSLNAGTITMEDLENFLETTDRHLKRCSEKQIALQKDRDRLYEVNKINESEIINLKKFLTEFSVSFKTFSSIKDVYAQKLSRVISVQRTARREILNLEGHITDAAMCKLERGYAAAMQDLSECAMNLERWVERCIMKTISPEKIKQAFTETERSSLASSCFQNASIEIQLEELDKSFQKLLEEVLRAQKGEGARDQQAITVMEVRAEYEDKLNRMKAKMKDLYNEQMTIYKEKQKQEVAMLEYKLKKAQEKLAESSRRYEEHIRSLTTELWSVGEKFLMQKEETDWMRRKQHSNSLMSLQHVHSSGLVPPQELPPRPSDSHSLRSLPVNTNDKRQGRGLHMSDEEGEVFDNRYLKELSATPRSSRPSRTDGQRLSELQYRNSLCPPHLKSSYPAETQFAPTIDEDDIKCLGARSKQRKEVGITAYKKPGPPTPSKQAGRLSATDSELRESLRVEVDPQAPRKTSTPSRLRSLFFKTDTTDGTPRSKRLSFFRKK